MNVCQSLRWLRLVCLNKSWLPMWGNILNLSILWLDIERELPKITRNLENHFHLGSQLFIFTSLPTVLTDFMDINDIHKILENIMPSDFPDKLLLRCVKWSPLGRPSIFCKFTYVQWLPSYTFPTSLLNCTVILTCSYGSVYLPGYLQAVR